MNTDFTKIITTRRQAIIAGATIVGLIITGLFGYPCYNVWRQEMIGRAELAKAEQNRQIRVAEATAQKDSAKALAEAEVIRAQGVAEANKIIGDSLRGNESYLRYLYINSLAESGQAQVIYIPTEAGLPILEAGKRGI